ncbi:MAG: sulfite exporter TauE/SafE family protein [Alphaproteobacteria bacterium]|nr:sulfite exporter TauE/SafE family protein [Alphaproteobacteria bacterium]
MEIYFPIANMAMPIISPILIGVAVGVLSGMFGVGGGFLMNPLLIMLGVPPTVAVATGTLQITAASVSGAFTHWRRGTLDPIMATCMVGGGLLGALAGNRTFVLLKSLGQIDLVIALAYVILLGSMGGMMLAESARAILRRRGAPVRRKLHPHGLLHGLPLKVKFRKSRLYISVFIPCGLGFVVGVMTAIMGVGGGFLAVPAMIYMMAMPVTLTVGTSLLQITVVSAVVVFLHALSTQGVDLVLALLLILGGVAGAQVGTIFGQRLRGEETRFLLALMVLAVCAYVLYGLVATPDELYTIEYRPMEG